METVVVSMDTVEVLLITVVLDVKRVLELVLRGRNVG